MSVPTVRRLSSDRTIRRLDDEASLGLVVDLWEERGWTVRDTREPDGRYVEFVFAKGWPEERVGLLRYGFV